MGQFAPFAYSPARKVHKFFLINNKEELNSKYVSNFSTGSSLQHLRQPLHHDPSAFCRVILGGKWARGFDGDFLRIKGAYCIILDLM